MTRAGCMLALLLGLWACGDATSRGEADAALGLDADGGGASAECAPPRVACGVGRCVDLSSDDAACGTCDTVCSDRERCSDGACRCAPGFERCGRACVDTSADGAHCGGCGLACAAGEVCDGGVCQLACADGATACGDACVDLATDLSHCGACDRACLPGFNATATCEAGACLTSCNEGYYDLDGARGCETFCAPAVPGVEICDGEDNDCDGLLDAADPDWAAPACPNTAGVCASATQRCAAGALSGCDAATYRAAAEAAGQSWAEDEASCDGVDNDCDGEVDEGCCGRDRTFVVPDVDDLGREDWQVYRTVNVAIGDRVVTAFAGNDVPANYPDVRVGLLSVGDGGEVEFAAVPGEWNRQPYFGVLEGEDDETMQWWLAAETGVRVGVTTLGNDVRVPFAAAPAEYALPSSNLAGVTVAPAARSIVTLIERGLATIRVSGVDRFGAWTAVSLEDFAAIYEPTVFASDAGVRACAMVRDGTDRSVRCWLFDSAMRLDDEVLLNRAPSLSFPSPAMPLPGGGVAFHFAAGVEGCAIDCEESVYRVELRRDGTIEAVDTGLDARSGLAHAWPGPDGRAWIFVASDVDLAAGRATYDLYRPGDDGPERVARFDRAAPLSPAALLVDDGDVVAVLRAPNAARTANALLTYRFTADGVALCGPNIPPEDR